METQTEKPKQEHRNQTNIWVLFPMWKYLNESKQVGETFNSVLMRLLNLKLVGDKLVNEETKKEKVFEFINNWFSDNSVMTYEDWDEFLRGIEAEQEQEYPKQLPIYKIKGKLYFLDKRLNEYRNVKNPSDRLDFDKVSLEDLENPNEPSQEEEPEEFNQDDLRRDEFEQLINDDDDFKEQWASDDGTYTEEDFREWEKNHFDLG